jgi:nucleoid DNA-binding protein
VTKKEIVRSISDKTGLTQLQIKEIVQFTFEGIIDTLLKEGRVELRNFGVFQVKSRKARKARNPKTGHQVEVPEKFVVSFKAGKEMEARVQDLEELAMDRARSTDDQVLDSSDLDDSDSTLDSSVK